MPFTNLVIVIVSKMLSIKLGPSSLEDTISERENGKSGLNQWKNKMKLKKLLAIIMTILIRLKIQHGSERKIQNASAIDLLGCCSWFNSLT